jgi:pilus assembly protein Flp/PilA
MMKKLANFFKEEDGATAVEYGIMVAIIAIGIIASVGLLRDALIETFTTASEHLPG